MGVSICFSQLNIDSNEYIYKVLKNRDKSLNHIILVPDRCALNMESLLFDKLNENCFFDISVMTISRFCNLKLKENNIDAKVITKNDAIAIIKKLLIKNKNDLIHYKNSSNFYGFAKKIFETICLYKSSNIAPCNININTKNNFLNKKLTDIKLIYQKYEEEMNLNHSDTFNRLNLFIDSINKYTFENTNFYIMNFDDFTRQGYNLINKLIVYSQDVFISTTYSKVYEEKKNKNIYLNNIYYEVIDICKNSNINYKVIDCDKLIICNNDTLKMKNFLKINLLANCKNKFSFKQDFVSVYKFNNIIDEIKYFASLIKFNVINNNFSFNDYSIIIPQIEMYKNDLIKIFDEFDIPYYLDKSQMICDNFFCKFLVNYLNFLISFDFTSLLSILKSGFFEIADIEINYFENFLKKYAISNENILNFDFENYDLEFDYTNLKCTLKNISAKLNIFKSCKSIFDYSNFTIQLLDEYFTDIKIEKFKNIFIKYNKLDQLRYLNTISKKIKDELNNLVLILNDFECSSAEFLELFNVYLENTPLGNLPLINNSVFIGDALNSFFDGVNNLIILGNIEGVMPSVLSDSALLSDNDLKIIDKSEKIGPLITFVNKKNRFKIFSNCFACNKLLLSFFENNSNCDRLFPNNIIVNLNEIFNINIVDGSNMLSNYNWYANFYDDDKLLFNNFNLNTSKFNFVEMLNNWKLFKNNKYYLDNLSTLYNCNKDYFNIILDNKNYRNILDDIDFKELIFKNDSTSVSQIELYNKCPYKHFVSYVLKLREIKDGSVAINDIGTILHEFMKFAIVWLKNNLESSKKEKIKFVKEKIDSILTDNKLDFKYIIKNKENKNLINSLLNECVNILLAMEYQLINSNYQPKYLEKYFGEDGGISFNINGKIISIRGIIDRIDVCENNFRIIDYKTGSDDFTNYTDLYYGKKLQLYLYVCAFEKYSNMHPTGLFYIKLTNDFSTNSNLEKYKLIGIMENELQNFIDTDKNYCETDFESKIYDFKDKKGKFKKMILEQNQINNLINYATNFVCKSLEKIKNGNINPYPLFQKGKFCECTYCKYSNMCKFNEKHFNTYNLVDNITDINKFVEGEK